MSKVSIKDNLEGLYGWWKRDKLSGTLIIILLSFVVTKLILETDYSLSQMIFVGTMTLLIIGRIGFYYHRDMKITTKLIDHKKHIKELDHAIDKFEQQKTVENFAMTTIEMEKEKQFAMIQEQSEHIQQDICEKTDHIIYLTENFEMSSRLKDIIDMHKDEIGRLREYRIHLPEKIRLSFKDFLDVHDMPKIRTKPTEIRNELEALITEVKLLSSLDRRVIEIETQIEDATEVVDLTE